MYTLRPRVPAESPAASVPEVDRLAVVASPPLAPVDWATEAAGAVVLGGDHGSLGVARSLGRRGIPVWFVSDDNLIARYSRFTARSRRWPGPNDPRAVEFLLDLAARHRLEGWVLFPAGDREVKLIAQNHDVLARTFRLWTLPWEVLKLAVDKQLMYGHAASLGIPHPQTYPLRSRHDAATLDCRFPLILKPSAKEGFNAFTQAKAWRVDNRAELAAKYDAAARLVGDDRVVLQELIPGGGETQFSYTGVWNEGAPVASMIARRTRQYPVEFGTGTYVESIDNDEVERAAAVFLASLDYRGLAEIEFKFDGRDGRYKILDANPRIWTWHALGELAGIDFPLVQWRMAMGEKVAPMRGRPGAAWMYVPKDVVASLQEIVAGRLTVRGYLGSFMQPLALAAWSAADPLPGVVDLPLALVRGVREWFAGG